MLLHVKVSRDLQYERNTRSQQTHTVDALPLSEGFAFCKFRLQLFSHYLLSSGFATEKK